MKDKVLIYAIGISVVLHLVAVGVIGRTSGSRLSTASVVTAPQRLLNVDLIKDPLSAPPKPKPRPVPVPERRPNVAPEPARPSLFARISSFVGIKAPSHSEGPVHRAPTSPVRVASNAGGRLKLGSSSRNGDLAMGSTSGTTGIGRVPGAEHGLGNGSGSQAGVGTPEPPRTIEEPHHTAPPPPPPPKRVTVRICEISGMLAGEHCRNTRNETYNDGDEPRHVCDRCKAPEPPPAPVHVSRLADQARPVLTHDASARVPDSVEEGESFVVEVEYWVDTDGSVSGVRISQSSGNRDCDREAASIASKWRYSPAVQDGVPRRVKVARKVSFRG